MCSNHRMNSISWITLTKSEIGGPWEKLVLYFTSFNLLLQCQEGGASRFP